LRALPLREGWIYEVIVCTSLDGTPHAAPFGTWTDDRVGLEFLMYEDSRTLRNVLATRELVVAFPANVHTLFAALFAPGGLTFGRALTVGAPTLDGAQATVELTVDGTRPVEDAVRVSAMPRRVEVEGDVTPLNRADGLLLESLVLATRAELPGAPAVLPVLDENLRVVRKVAPGSAAERDLEALVRRLRSASSA